MSLKNPLPFQTRRFVLNVSVKFSYFPNKRDSRKRLFAGMHFTSVSVESGDFQRFLVGSFDLEGAIMNSAGIAHF